MSPQDFELHPPGKPALLFTLFFAVLLPFLLLAGLLLVAPPVERQELLLVSAALLVMPLFGAGMAWGLLHQRVRLADSGLRLRTLPFPYTLRPVDLDLDLAEIIDLGTRPELMPSIKIFGTRIPGYRAGSFRLRDKRHAWVLLTDLRKVLVLPRRGSGPVLLSVQRPEALLQALRRHR